MVVVLGNNEYSLTRVDETTSVLTLGRKYYLWSKTPDGNNQLTRIKKPIKPASRSKKGNYWLFDVQYHTRYSPGIHLSLASENASWRAYIIDGHFPLKLGESCFLIPTTERIARSGRNLLRTTVAV